MYLVAAKVAPRLTTEDQKQSRVEILEDLLEMEMKTSRKPLLERKYE